tara:strand:+ start:1805 stop:2074 length:270 start_codon:yes stop_codon:yes gene_type:complete
MSKYDPVWKRELPSAVDDAADVMSGYQQQLEINFIPRDATPQEALEWQEKELAWWGDRQLNIVALATGVQVFVFFGMLMTMKLIGAAFS